MSAAAPADNIKQKIIISLENLPPEGLDEVITFLDYMRFKFQKKSQPTIPYQPVAFGGLWKDETIDDKDINELRQEMWQSLGNREL